MYILHYEAGVCQLWQFLHTNSANFSKRKYAINLGRQGEATVINEAGLYKVILRSDKPEAKAFARWVTHEVLPAIRKTGGYTATPMTDAQRRRLEIMEKNARARNAQIFERLATQYDGTFKQILHAYATKELAGEFLLPLPALPERTYTATELAKQLGVSANAIGLITNRHNLKTDEYGQWFNDKAKGHNKEVQSFRYYANIITVLESILKVE